MNEADARAVVWVRAIERSDVAGKLITAEDRIQLDRTAAELMRWQTAGQGIAPSAEAFIAQRARLLGTRIGERSAEIAQMFGRLRWRPWIGQVIPLLALLIGIIVEHVVDRHRLSILAFPLLGLIVWNLAIYLWLLLRLLRRPRTDAAGNGRFIQRALSGLVNPFRRRAPSRAVQWHEDFVRDWLARSAPLNSARLARILHLSAAMLAIGAVAGLYLRGLMYEYRAGWESTFLDASMVHTLLSSLLQPIATLIAQPFPSVEEIAALRWDRGDGENAAPWIYLYTSAVSIAVILPRLGLASIAWLRERKLTRHFPLGLDEAYFRRILASWRTVPAYLRVLPYAYTIDEQTAEGLRRLARMQFGEDAQVHIFPTVTLGEEESAELKTSSGARKADLDIVLFNLASTPESEHHGVLLDQLRAKANSGMAILVDESAYRSRLGAQSGSGQRLQERRQAWTAFAAARQLKLQCIDLQASDAAVFEQYLHGQTSAPDEPAHAH